MRNPSLIRLVWSIRKRSKTEIEEKGLGDAVTIQLLQRRSSAYDIIAHNGMLFSFKRMRHEDHRLNLRDQYAEGTCLCSQSTIS